MDDKQIKEVSDMFMGCGCSMMLLVILIPILIFGLMFIASVLGLLG
jgi:uncharacterized protein YqhQ